MKPGLENRAWRFVLLCIFLLFASAGYGIVLHNDNQPLAQDRPANAVVGRWGSNASCVVISPNHILTTRHQTNYASGIGIIIQIEGTSYKVTQETNIASDLRVARLTTMDGQWADLSDYVGLYQQSNEAGKNMVLGGYGRGRGDSLTSGPSVYGYRWDDSGNSTLRWCTNKIKGEYTDPWLIEADFDDLPGNGGYQSTAFEGTMAARDSGGGWFIKQGNSWYIAGVNWNISSHGSPWPAEGESWFRNPSNPNQLAPDTLVDLRVSYYFDDIDVVIAVPRIISGYALDLDDPLEEVLVEGDNMMAGFTLTDSNGYYELWVPDEWSGTVTPSKAGYIFSPANTVYSNVTVDYSNQDYDAEVFLSDDFNDNRRGYMWRKLEDDYNSVWVDELGERLEISAVNEPNDFEAVYASNGWTLDPAGDFSLKVDFHHSSAAGNDSRVFIELRKDPNNYILFGAGYNANGRYWRFKKVIDGGVVEDSNSPRSSDDGTLYISYDVSGDELYLSYTGYEVAQAWQTIADLLQTQWAGAPVYVSIGGGAYNAGLSSGEAYLDNFEVNSGILSGWPSTDINDDGDINWLDVRRFSEQWLKSLEDLGVGEDLDADINGDKFVNFADFDDLAELWQP